MAHSDVQTSRQLHSHYRAQVSRGSLELADGLSFVAADLVLSSVAAGQTITTTGVVRNDVSLGAGAVLTEPAGGDLVIFGSVAGPSSGTAAIVVATGATLYAAGPVSAAISASFAGPGGTLQLAGLYLPNMAGSIAGFAPGDVIDVISQTLTDAVFVAAGESENLTLLDEGTVLATLALVGTSAGGVAFAVPDPVDGSRIILAAALPAVTAQAAGTSTGSLFAWGSKNQAGQWSDPALWRTVGGGTVSVAPGMHDTVDIAGAQTSMLVVAGNAAAATLSTQGLVALEGSFAVGNVLAGANSADVLLLTAGSQFVANAATLIDGVLQVAAAGAVLSVTNMTALGSATLWVADGGLVQVSTLSLAGGSLRTGANGTVSVGGVGGQPGAVSIASAGTVSGAGAVYAPIQNDGFLHANGTLDIFGVLSGGGVTQIGAGSELYIPDGAGPGQQLEFQAATGTIELFGSATTCAASISGFGIGDVVDIASDTVSQAVWTPGAGGLAGTLDLGQAGTLAVAVAAGLSTTAVGFNLVGDGLGGTLVQMVPCFVGGTRLARRGGTVAVEHVGVGDRLLTRTGAARRVNWVGNRYYGVETLRQQPQLRPVRIRRGALGRGLPTRDLCLSPQHAIAMTTPAGPRLVPAVGLVDGRAIVREAPVEGVWYFHVELDDHDLLLSAGLPVESFLPGGPERRDLFQSESGIRGEAATPILPRLDQGHELESLREYLGLDRGGDCHPTPTYQTAAGNIDCLQLNGSTLLVEGWATYLTLPNLKLTLELRINHATRTTVVANGWRPDLDRAGYAGGSCSFSTTVSHVTPRSVPGRALELHLLPVDVTALSNLPGRQRLRTCHGRRAALTLV